MADDSGAPFPLPRVTIKFCTQCKWMLRAAYYAQELLSTFSTSLGEVALQPSTGGTFVVEIFAAAAPSDTTTTTTAVLSSRVLWDRKTDGGFPETKELKRRVRDVIEPGRDLGHVDRDHPKKKPPPPPSQELAGQQADAGKDEASVDDGKQQQQQQQQQAGGSEGACQSNKACEDCA